MHRAKGSHVDVPILESVLRSNEAHFRRTYDLLTANGRRRIGLFGLAFKPGTDELRESPFVELAERLIGKGYDLRIYDPSIHLPSLTGTNREYIEEHLPHLKQLLAETAGEVVEHAETCIVASRARRGGPRARGRGRPDDHRPGPAARTPLTSNARPSTTVSPGRALILVENLSVPFDRRVWQECRALREAGYEVSVICPQGEPQDREPYALIDGIEIHRYPLTAATGGWVGLPARVRGGALALLAARAPPGPTSTSSTSATRPTCCSWSRCR